MDVPDDRQHAKRLVQEIARNYGYLGQEALNGLEHSVKREIETALLLTRDPVVGPAAITWDTYLSFPYYLIDINLRIVC